MNAVKLGGTARRNPLFPRHFFYHLSQAHPGPSPSEVDAADSNATALNDAFRDIQAGISRIPLPGRNDLATSRESAKLQNWGYGGRFLEDRQRQNFSFLGNNVVLLFLVKWSLDAHKSPSNAVP